MGCGTFLSDSKLQMIDNIIVIEKGIQSFIHKLFSAMCDNREIGQFLNHNFKS